MNQFDSLPKDNPGRNILEEMASVTTREPAKFHGGGIHLTAGVLFSRDYAATLSIVQISAYLPFFGRIAVAIHPGPYVAVAVEAGGVAYTESPPPAPCTPAARARSPSAPGL